ncbi:Cytochrome c oxidase (cbb3-type) subunit CcoP [hydrothermal vent metagenome]|uniref:Cytochrome c oxidase subunit III n=1 Tax=hydrothermal vent metagenome TaxID=652676 RepID=A0A3B0W400_9ZZZZ
MSDFTSEFWSWFIIVIAGGGIVWLIYLLKATNKADAEEDQGVPTGHVWDENLEELNNPLPRWWLVMFYLTIVFAVVYLILYPGMGTYKGVLGWTQIGEYEQEVAAANTEFGPLFAQFEQTPVAELATNEKAINAGERLFVSYCAVCHGSDARGAPGFPNLRDNDWLYGGAPDQIEASIMNGRMGTMPAWEAPLGGEEGVNQVATYVMRLAGRKVDEELATAGKAKFDLFCVGCHMPDGTGNIALGAPNLTNNIWLYGGSPRSIKESIAKGRSGQMPAHSEFLGKDKSHVLAAYIYSLSHESD